MLHQTIINQLLKIMVLCYLVDKVNKDIVLRYIVGPISSVTNSGSACVPCVTSCKIRSGIMYYYTLKYPFDGVIKSAFAMFQFFFLMLV